MSRSINQIVSDVMDSHDDVQEEESSALGGLIAELTGGPKVKKADDDYDVDYDPEVSNEEQDELDARRAADPDAVPEDWNETAEWEKNNHAKMESMGLDDNGSPLVERDPEEVDREIETAAHTKAREVAAPTTAAFNGMLRQQVEAEVAMVQQLAAQIPEFEEDPAEHTRLNNLLTEAKAELRERVRAREQQAVTFERDVGEALPFALASEAKFKQQAPDYEAALDHLHGAISQQMKARYPGVSDAEIGRTQAFAALQHAKDCKARGVNPSQEMYNTALQFGFKGQGVKAPAPRPSVPNVTLAQVSQMNDEEFEAYFSEVQQAGHVRPTFGGKR